MVFRPGHPPYYTGGSVKGHAPTSTGAHLPKGMHAGNTEWSFAEPRGRVNQIKGRFMSKSKSKERECMEAIQNGKTIGELVAFSRYPDGMVRRLHALHEVASDSTHKDFLHAHRLVREILMERSSEQEKDAATAAPAVPAMTVHVFQGKAIVPLPGEPGAPMPKQEGGEPG